jgi:hypothetical protein
MTSLVSHRLTPTQPLKKKILLFTKTREKNNNNKNNNTHPGASKPRGKVVKNLRKATEQS